MVIGRIRGGLGHVTVVTHLVFSGVSGAALADIGALGSIQINMMREQGYKDEFSAGICMAAATLGPIFPPSIPLVIFAMAAEISPVKLLLAGVIPSLIIAGFLMGMIAWMRAQERPAARRHRGHAREVPAASCGSPCPRCSRRWC